MRFDGGAAVETHSGVQIAPHSAGLWTRSSAPADPQYHRMYLIYTALALAEICVFLASALGVLFLILRGIVRLFRAPDADPPRVEQDTRHLKRAGASHSG